MTDEDLLHQLKAASENHCLFYEQVSGEWIDGAERKKNEKSDCIHICASWKYGKISKKDSRRMSGGFDRCYKTNEHASVVGKFGCKGYDTFGPFKLVGGIAKGHPDEEDMKNAVDFVKGLH